MHSAVVPMVLVAMLGVAAEATSTRTLLQGPPNIAPKCPKPTNLAAIPSDLKPVWTVEAAGTRNFTCIGGKPVVDGALSKLTGDGYTGTTYYQPPEPSQEAGRVGYFIFDFGTVKYLGATLQNSTFPAPNGALSYAVWPVTAVSGKPACDYITRTNTSGGAAPTTCGTTAENGLIAVPFTGTYKCYECA